MQPVNEAQIDQLRMNLLQISEHPHLIIRTSAITLLNELTKYEKLEQLERARAEYERCLDEYNKLFDAQYDDAFIEYLFDTKPEWFSVGNVIDYDILFDEHAAFTSSEMSKRMFTQQYLNKIFVKRKRTTVNGKKIQYIEIIHYEPEKTSKDPKNTSVRQRGAQYVYIVHEREFLTQNLPVYKIGKTIQTNPNVRLSAYPKHSKLIACCTVTDCTKAENEIIHTFNELFIHRTDIGNEYYEGDLSEIRGEFFEICEKC